MKVLSIIASLLAVVYWKQTGIKEYLLIGVIFGVIFIMLLILKGNSKKSSSDIIEEKEDNSLDKYNEAVDSFFDISIADFLRSIFPSKQPEDFGEEERKVIISLIPAIARKSMEDSLITREEEQKISELLDVFDINFQSLEYDQQVFLVKNLLVRDLIEGQVYPRCELKHETGFNIGKKETVVWFFPLVNISEIKIKKERVGAHSGFSFRVMKGVYYHTGGSHGQTIEKETMQEIGNGYILVTSKYLYVLSGNYKAKRISLEKIISVVPDQNGVMVVVDGSSPKPLYFQDDDPVFMANIIQNASNWDK